MSATEHNNDRTPPHKITKLSDVKPYDGDDRQLPGIGYRRDRPTLPPVQELPAQQTTTPMRSQARFLLTRLSTLVPIAAFAVPLVRRQRLAAHHADASKVRLTSVADQGGTLTPNRVLRTTGGQSGGRYSLGLLPSLLLGALLGGGATLLYFSRRNAGAHASSQLAPEPRQPQPEQRATQTAVPMISGAVKEAAVTMVSQAQEMLSEARSTSNEEAAAALDILSDEHRTVLPNAETADAQSAGTLDEATRIQAVPATAAPSGSTEQPNAAPVTTPTSNERQPEAAVAPALPITLSLAEERSPQQEPPASAKSTPHPAKREEEPAAPTPPRPKTASEAAAAPANLQARIKEHMPVLDRKGMRVGAVDRVEASGSIKLAKDGQGKHHWLPLHWVTRVDTHVHLSRTAQQVRREWKTSAPRAH